MSKSLLGCIKIWREAKTDKGVKSTRTSTVPRRKTARGVLMVVWLVMTHGGPEESGRWYAGTAGDEQEVETATNMPNRRLA